LSERTEIDKAAAGRFIKHAITQATSAKQQLAEDFEPTIPEPSTSSSVRAPVKVTSKMLERQRYEQELKEQDDAQNEEEELAVFGDDDMSMDMDSSASKGKGKQVLSATQEPIPEPSNKRRRPAVDPFAGKDFITCVDVTPLGH
jgi:exosome complex protein LRP1